MQKIGELLKYEKVDGAYEVSMYLGLITRKMYTIAVVSCRKWGGEDSETESGIFYQIMPESSDDGFFDWYCRERPYNQFFLSIESAILHFVMYWTIWNQEIKNI